MAEEVLIIRIFDDQTQTTSTSTSSSNIYEMKKQKETPEYEDQICTFCPEHLSIFTRLAIDQRPAALKRNARPLKNPFVACGYKIQKKAPGDKKKKVKED